MSTTKLYTSLRTVYSGGLRVLIPRRNLSGSPVSRKAGHDEHNGPYAYLHASRMYDLSHASKWKYGLATFTFVATGLGLPFFMVWVTQKKAGLM
ncbi:hypothetical protein CCYA_CCYA01G0231 [Cyanidiococcus yangmingshanensis]|nr:hypothetical protein CCYA_CCYA01G0231 [Cyanidiococcus yangmingshanensis]